MTLIEKITALALAIGSDIKALTINKANDSDLKRVAKTGEFNDLNNIPSNALGNKTVSTSAPSGGQDGDIWYRVE